MNIVVSLDFNKVSFRCLKGRPVGPRVPTKSVTVFFATTTDRGKSHRQVVHLNAICVSTRESIDTVMLSVGFGNPLAVTIVPKSVLGTRVPAVPVGQESLAQPVCRTHWSRES